MKVIGSRLRKTGVVSAGRQPPSPYVYRPSPLLFHHSLQSIYEHFSKDIIADYEREKIFFDDGGHITLDWANKCPDEQENDHVPIVFVMHGMTGGSECRYMKLMAKMSMERGYTSVCMNSRGFNSDMTSPVPFVGIHFNELEAAIQRVKTYYPRRPIHMVGMSLGGNYLLRFLLREIQENRLPQNIKSLSLVCPPFDVKYVIKNMNQQYQHYFMKYYLQCVVLRHEQMQFWWHNGIVDLEHLKASKNILEFHQRVTEKILGEPIDDFFDQLRV